ncbi:MAG: tRNA (guanine(10)-N(2))-dimethyltransferase [Thermoprotei archaeon]
MSEYSIVNEGKISIVVFPRVFYNKFMELSRDISVGVIKAYYNLVGKKLRICEPLAATGIRGLRYLIETDGVDKLCLNDISKEAYANIKENVKRLHVEDKVEVFNTDANILLSNYGVKGKRFDVIDLDPFGSPIRFVHAAIKAIKNGGLLGVSHTDVAPLCGVHGKSCLRRYQSIPLKNEFCHETAVRIILGYLIRISAIYGFGIEPLLSHATRHYIRIFIRLHMKPSALDESLSNLGYISYCRNCLWRIPKKSIVSSLLSNCPHCGSQLEYAGILWLGPLGNADFIKNVAEIINKSNYKLSSHEEKLVNTLANEACMPPTYYQLDSMAKKHKISSISVETVMRRLIESGFRVSRTHFHPKGIKTDAPFLKLLEIIKGIA